ncbi:pentapeptide repeat-containing protein [Breoghania sp.]|uniref:pentapeptide repeat-containing protein n=1 Tax=Breoghania sp. TaxID=2065378 RepID=UPI0026249C3E|nr:pentapeptide repeat-containing protein [Breoghania sp.]MDJ0933372.1 pentapeptide repeat-containing protein [Breoghania sp.]
MKTESATCWCDSQSNFSAVFSIPACGVHRSLSNENFSGVYFHAQDLRDIDFSGAAFRGCAFDFALIEEAVFRGALVDRAVLFKASG